MILLIHQQATHGVKIIKDNKEVDFGKNKLSEIFWNLAETYPEEVIVWCEEDIYPVFNPDSLSEIFHHNLVMASYSVKTIFLSDAIGYIDQLPFVNINRKVFYPTWRMSTDLGGIKGKVLLQFQDIFNHIQDFGYLINSIAKLGQQNGLFCYSAPQLVFGDKLDYQYNQNIKKEDFDQVFTFTYAHYKTIRLFLLFWCCVKYERSFPLYFLFKALFQKKFFKKNIDLSGIGLRSNKHRIESTNIDVIIPTLGRRDYLLQVLDDLKLQTLIPKKVIVVEQNPEKGSQTELPELKTNVWPFEIIHHFIHKTGACNARNIALEEVSSPWVFFADDDNRMEKDVLEKALQEIDRIGAGQLTFKYSQEGETSTFGKIKQWGTFGSGNSIVSYDFVSLIRFDIAFEKGYGEDKDYGMQLRNMGCDIIYHPQLEILHLKAPRGGFRQKLTLQWEKDNPKPSPTVMVYAIKHYTLEQFKGFKTEMFLRYYSKQDVRNPIKYIKNMRVRWDKSEEWASKLIKGSNTVEISKSV